jgi:hypothetical protein
VLASSEPYVTRHQGRIDLGRLYRLCHQPMPDKVDADKITRRLLSDIVVQLDLGALAIDNFTLQTIEGGHFELEFKGHRK